MSCSRNCWLPISPPFPFRPPSTGWWCLHRTRTCRNSTLAQFLRASLVVECWLKRRTRKRKLSYPPPQTTKQTIKHKLWNYERARYTKTCPKTTKPNTDQRLSPKPKTVQTLAREFLTSALVRISGPSPPLPITTVRLLIMCCNL